MKSDPAQFSADDAGRQTHPFAEVLRLTGFSQATLVVFCEQGFVAPLAGAPAREEDWQFDNDALRLLRHLARLHRQHGLDLTGLQMVGPLLAELENLRAEVRFLRRG